MNLIKELLQKYSINAHARRAKLTILVDENVEALRDSLIDFGFKIIILRKQI
jgi:hypothetical protein